MVSASMGQVGVSNILPNISQTEGSKLRTLDGSSPGGSSAVSDRIDDPGSGDPLHFLHGGGEMGERIRLLDWSATALGPIEQWPQSLKTAVSTSLGCAFPIILWWGAECHRPDALPGP